jgi:tetratricopeptide (TPR) repeat protein
MRSVVLALALALAASPAAADPKPAEILEKAIAKQTDPKALEGSLAEIEAVLKKAPKDPDAHYAHGWILSHLGRSDQAIEAYDRAFELDRTLADAAYNAGVVLAHLGKTSDAVERFDRALAANPKLVDAAYNAGQSYYDLKKYAKAAERWRSAAALAPDDFATAKKLVQAYVALDDTRQATRWRDKVFELWKATKDAELKKLTAYVYDQFDVDANHVYAFEAFEPKDYVFRFAVTEKDKPLFDVVLAPSSTGYALWVDKAGARTGVGVMWNRQPDYKTVKAEAIKAIRAKR